MVTYLVLAAAAGIIYYIGREVAGSYHHPTDDQLIKYYGGELQRSDRRQFRQISEHLATCEDCRDRLDAIRRNNPGPGAADPLITRRY